MIKGSYLQGLLFILIVTVLWSGSSVLAKLLYTNFSFNSPFFLTYCGSAQFSLWLPVNYLEEWVLATWRRLCGDAPTTDENMNGVYQTIQTQTPADEEDAAVQTALDDGHGLSNSGNQNGMYRSIGSEDDTYGQGGTAVVNRTNAQPVPWTTEQHVRVALCVAPVWFIANWSYNASLLETSITSSTVLASTSSLFTFVFAVCAKDEKFLCLKLVGVLLGMFGTFLTTLNDDGDGDDRTRQLLGWRLLEGASTGGNNPVLGDFLSLVSAIGYGTYTVQTRVFCPQDESLYSMQVILGYIGVVNTVLFAPILIFILLDGFRCPWQIVGVVLFKGLFDNFLSDYLWLRSVILTNATVATVGLGLTIPFAFVSDLALRGASAIDALSIAGAVSVLAGFVTVNLTSATSADDNPDDNPQERLESSSSTECADESNHTPDGMQMGSMG